MNTIKIGLSEFPLGNIQKVNNSDDSVSYIRVIKHNYFHYFVEVDLFGDIIRTV